LCHPVSTCLADPEKARDAMERRQHSRLPGAANRIVNTGLTARTAPGRLSACPDFRDRPVSAWGDRTGDARCQLSDIRTGDLCRFFLTWCKTSQPLSRHAAPPIIGNAEIAERHSRGFADDTKSAPLQRRRPPPDYTSCSCLNLESCLSMQQLAAPPCQTSPSVVDRALAPQTSGTLRKRVTHRPTDHAALTARALPARSAQSATSQTFR
jgi:hypothetical protein